jgi:peptide/nickel transport system permease protein
MAESETTSIATTVGRRPLSLGAWLAIGWLGLVVVAALLAPLLPLPDPNETVAAIARKGPGTNGHLLGGDTLGRDVLSRLVWGGRASLPLAFGAIGLGIVAGTVLGLVAGYFRGKTSVLVSGAFDVMLSIPQLVLVLTAVTVFALGDGVTGGRRMLVLFLALGVVSIPLLGRIVRASTLSWSQREFVTAARAMGQRNRTILVREVLPNVLPALFSVALLAVAVVIVAEGGLAVLGVGILPPTPSWGNILAEGRSQLRTAPHLVIAPTIVIFLTVLALNYLGDVVRKRFDVREASL